MSVVSRWLVIPMAFTSIGPNTISAACNNRYPMHASQCDVVHTRLARFDQWRLHSLRPSMHMNDVDADECRDALQGFPLFSDLWTSILGSIVCKQCFDMLIRYEAVRWHHDECGLWMWGNQMPSRKGTDCHYLIIDTCISTSWWFPAPNGFNFHCSDL